jgi:endo-1,4-beta-xylanase
MEATHDGPSARRAGKRPAMVETAVPGGGPVSLPPRADSPARGGVRFEQRGDMVRSIRILAFLCLWQLAGLATVADTLAAGRTAGATSDSAGAQGVAAAGNRGPRQLLGTAIDIHRLDARPELRDIVERYGFAWMTDPGFMFMPYIMPARDTYNFESGDRLVAYAQARGMQTVGHALVDPHNTPAWLLDGYRAGTISNAEARAIFSAFITTTVSRYCGQIAAWNVVNEPFADTGSGVFRTNSRAAYDQNMFWYEVYGGPDNGIPTYLTTALTLARQACPSARLFINDYQIEAINGGDYPKANRIIPALQSLKSQGLLDGIGFEGHFHKSIDLNHVRNGVKTYTDLGLEVAFTELEVRMRHGFPLPGPKTGESVELTPAELEEQARIYGTLATICQQNPRCTRFTVWGIDDQAAFANVHFGPEAALLFRYDHGGSVVAKPAYFAVANALGITVLPPTGSPCVGNFGDVGSNNANCLAIEALTARGIINGCDKAASPPLFCPGDTTLRMQMAALIVRAMPDWQGESHGNSFTDPPFLFDEELWRRVATLQHHGVVGGYTADSCVAQGKTPPCYGPLDPVLKAQAISFVTRAMVAKGYWTQQPTDANLYGGALMGTGHEQDATTYWHYTRVRGGVPDHPEHGGFSVGEEARRGWFARLLWVAIQGTPAAP